MTGLMYTHVLVCGFNCMLSLGRTSIRHLHEEPQSLKISHLLLSQMLSQKCFTFVGLLENTLNLC